MNAFNDVKEKKDGFVNKITSFNIVNYLPSSI